MSVEDRINQQEDEPKEDLETVNEKINELIRKEQGWDVKTQSKSKEGGLNEDERMELDRLSRVFKELGGRDALRKMKEEK